MSDFTKFSQGYCSILGLARGDAHLYRSMAYAYRVEPWPGELKQPAVA
jgi:hypothetical protein